MGSYLVVTFIFLSISRQLSGGTGLYIRFQPYILILFSVGFVTMLAVFIRSRTSFKSDYPYKLHLVSMMTIFIPTLIYQLIFDDFKTIQIAENQYHSYQKLYFYYFIFVAHSYIFGTLILLVYSFINLNRMSIVYSLISLAYLFGFFYLTV